VSDFVGGISGVTGQLMLFVHIKLHMAQRAVLYFNDNNNGAVISMYVMKTYESIAGSF
jgi:hypothetical protein